MLGGPRKRLLWLGAWLGLVLIGAGLAALAMPVRTAGVRFVPARAECAQGSDGESAFNYCIYRAQRGTNGGLVYHFHGRNGDAHGWNDADFFAARVVREVERRLGAPRYRALLGASMGGFNALLAALHRPELFSKAVALCPPIYTLTPSAGLTEPAFASRAWAPVLSRGMG